MGGRFAKFGAWHVAAVALIVAAIAVRFLWLGNVPGMQGDEAWYGIQARQFLAGGPVDMRTPTGNVPGFFQTGLSILLHAMFEPGLLLLRVPPLLSSFAAIAIIFACARRLLSAEAGWIAALVLAAAPIAIANARTGWDPSHSPLFLLVTTWAFWGNRPLLGGLLFALTLANQPATVFVAPFLLLSSVAFHDPAAGRGRFRAFLPVGSVLVAAIAFAMIVSPATGEYVSLRHSLARLANPHGWWLFGQAVVDLLSGQTSYAASSGVLFDHPGMIRAVGAAAIIGIAVAGARAYSRDSADLRPAGILLGWLASLAALYVIGGLWTLKPGLERFGFPMLVPTAFAIAIACHRSVYGRWIAWALGAALLAGAWTHYLRPLHRGDGRPLRGYWVAEADPARLAFDVISRDSTLPRETVGEDWWLTQPVAYYAVGTPIMVHDASPALMPAPRTWLTYDGSPLDRSLSGRAGFRKQWTVATRHRSNRINVWKETPASGSR